MELLLKENQDLFTPPNDQLNSSKFLTDKKCRGTAYKYVDDEFEHNQLFNKSDFF